MGVKERLSHYFVTYKQLFLLVLDNIKNVFSSQLESVSLFTDIMLTTVIKLERVQCVKHE